MLSFREHFGETSLKAVQRANPLTDAVRHSTEICLDFGSRISVHCSSCSRSRLGLCDTDCARDDAACEAISLESHGIVMQHKLTNSQTKIDGDPLIY